MCHTEFVLSPPGSWGATCARELPLSRGKTHSSQDGRRQFFGWEPGVPPGEAPPPAGAGGQGAVSLAVSIQRDGSQTVLGCEAGKRLLYTSISQRRRKIHSDWFPEGRVVAVGRVPPLWHRGQCPGLQVSFAFALTAALDSPVAPGGITRTLIRGRQRESDHSRDRRQCDQGRENTAPLALKGAGRQIPQVLSSRGWKGRRTVSGRASGVSGPRRHLDFGPATLVLDA